MTAESSDDSITDRIDALESTLEAHQETIERQEERLEAMAECEERGSTDYQPTSDSSGDTADQLSTRTVSRRRTLQALGLAGLVGLGASATSASAVEPQGQVGTEDRPLQTLFTQELQGVPDGGSPFDLSVGGERAIRIDANGGNAPNVVLGDETNECEGEGATISGGSQNVVSNDYPTVGGGEGNEATGRRSVVSGGRQNEANDLEATVAGGQGNIASGSRSTIGGGHNNEVTDSDAVVSGGSYNEASYRAAVPGGSGNTASGDYSFAMGFYSTASADKSTAIGSNAKANNIGSFVFSDSNNEDFEDTANDQFAVRATGSYSYLVPDNPIPNPAVRFVTDIDDDGEGTAGLGLLAGGSSWVELSDRNAKENVTEIDPADVLERLVSIPITEWNLKSQPESIRHIGPMAQDFNDQFGSGTDERFINSSDARGVAFAAIQGLWKLLEAKDVRIDDLESRVAELEDGDSAASSETTADD